MKDELGQTLNKCAEAIKDSRAVIESRRQQFWEDSLIASKEERKGWYLEVGGKDEGAPIPPADLISYEKLFDHVVYPKKLTKQIDLSTRFELRVATILRSYLPHKLDFPQELKPVLPRKLVVSLRTISRLTLLTYLSGELVAEGPDQKLELVSSKRAITVGGINQKLEDVMA